MSRPIITFAALATTLAAVALPPAPADAADPFMAPDGRSVSMTGSVASASRDSFIFDYGDGIVTVTMDDDDVGDETGRLDSGDRVTVYGDIDDEPMEATSILAEAVYVHDRDIWYVSGETGGDERSDAGTDAAAIPEAAESGVTVRISGTVSRMSGERLSLDTGSGRIDVDTSDVGTVAGPPLAPGDVIEARGTLDRRFAGERVLRAETIESIRSAGSQPAG